MIEIIGDLIIIGCGAAFAWAFFTMFITGNYLVFESNPIILAAEMILSVVIIVVGISRLQDDWWSKK